MAAPRAARTPARSFIGEVASRSRSSLVAGRRRLVARPHGLSRPSLPYRWRPPLRPARPGAAPARSRPRPAASFEWRRTSRGRPGAVSGQRRPNERAERLLRPPLGSILPPKVALPRRRRRGKRSGFWESSVCRRRAPAGSLARGTRYVVPSNFCSFLFGISF